MRAVIDTNVFVSALINPNGKAFQILSLILNQKISVLYDSRILNEYFGVLKRPKFGFNEELIHSIIDFVKSTGEFIPSEPVRIKFNDESDRPFYEVALTGRADFLVTGNLKHFPKTGKKLKIASPAKFIDHYLLLKKTGFTKKP